MTLLTNSIKTNKGINKTGVPSGTKCLIKTTNLLVSLDNLIESQILKDIPKITLKFTVKPNLYGIKPPKFSTNKKKNKPFKKKLIP